MNSAEKEISYNCTNTYSTLNKLSSSTQTIWMVFHGMGYLSRYFIRQFEILKPDENYIIAPQAPSKYYLPTKNKHVGASWLTKENTKRETENLMRYLDSVRENENFPENVDLNILGYSQGVSIAMRYAARRKIQYKNMILVSGGIPIELTREDFKFLNSTSKNYFIYGSKDEYLTETRIKSETEKFQTLFNSKGNVHCFIGNHDFNLKTVLKFVT